MDVKKLFIDYVSHSESLSEAFSVIAFMFPV